VERVTEPLRNIAVVLAGGVGSRIGADVPKQLLEIGGRTILGHAIAAFDSHPEVDEVIVMMAPGFVDRARGIVESGGYTKVSVVLEGAETRSGTTVRALDQLGDEECNVLLHDAARPLVTRRIISDCIEALHDHRAVNVAVPSADTIIEVTAENTIAAVPPRALLRRVQTPQAFRASVIKAAYARAEGDHGFTATDDCSVVLRYLPEEPIWVVTGDERNLKVTTPTDLALAESLLDRPG
jgi:2-C-methyl-D-erythritol 4-phosphate cytidylyltransferase